MLSVLDRKRRRYRYYGDTFPFCISDFGEIFSLYLAVFSSFLQRLSEYRQGYLHRQPHRLYTWCSA